MIHDYRSPFFSIVLPTRNRPLLAQQSIDRILQQSFADYEVLVMENSDVAIRAQFNFSDPRIQVLPSAVPLPMPDNWERALDYAKGDYLMVISDKDMLLPWALEQIAFAIDSPKPAPATLCFPVRCTR